MVYNLIFLCKRSFITIKKYWNWLRVQCFKYCNNVQSNAQINTSNIAIINYDLLGKLLKETIYTTQNLVFYDVLAFYIFVAYSLGRMALCCRSSFMSLFIVSFLAHLVMSLCNHALSVVCHCRCHRHLRLRCCLCHHWHWRLCTALPVTDLIIEASYLTNICSYAPSICTWILSQCDIYFLNGGHFSKFLYLALLSTWLNLEPSYLAQLCTYTGATHREEIIHLSIIFLKLWIFF